MEYYKVVHVAYQCRRLHCLESTLHNCALKGMTITISHLMQFVTSQQSRGGGGGRGEKSLEFKILDFQPGQILMELEKSQMVSEFSPSGVRRCKGREESCRNSGLVPKLYNTGTRIVCICSW